METVDGQIRRWIEEAVEPKDKAMLLILLTMNDGLSENTKITRSVAEEFTQHKESINGLLNRAKGAWFVLAVVFLAIQGIGVWVVNHTLTTMAEEIGHNQVQDVRLGVLDEKTASNTSRLTALERELHLRSMIPVEPER